MNGLHVIDLGVIVCYLVAMIGVGVYFSRKNKSTEQYSKASGTIPGWALGLSIYATFLSSNTFLGVPGKSFGTNWNSWVFSISMPFAAWFAAKYFVPFYRKTGSVSAYTQLEARFGPWARTYAVVCFLLTQLARIGSIFFGISITLQALTQFSMVWIMVVIGICIIIYTVLGGIEAVIWTEVVQGIIKTSAAFLILYLIVKDIPGGFSRIVDIGMANQKFSLGSFSPSLKDSTFWVILLYGFFINLNNFGMDQNYVQRYHTARSEKQASKSVWLCVYIYVPVSLLFFLIGTALFAFYQTHPDLLQSIKLSAAVDKVAHGSSSAMISQTAQTLAPADYGDKVMPDFMARKLPTGLLGLIVSAILSAAMSTISSGMNASATVFTEDIYKKYINKHSNDRRNVKVLYVATTVFGILGIVAGIMMIGVKSVLDIWWQLSGIFAGGMLGLFLLGIASRYVRNTEAIIATIIGVMVILWMTASPLIPEQYASLRSPFHTNMIIVIGTLTIFLTGLLISKFRNNKPVPAREVA